MSAHLGYISNGDYCGDWELSTKVKDLKKAVKVRDFSDATKVEDHFAIPENFDFSSCKRLYRDGRKVEFPICNTNVPAEHMYQPSSGTYDPVVNEDPYYTPSTSNSYEVATPTEYTNVPAEHMYQPSSGTYDPVVNEDPYYTPSTSNSYEVATPTEYTNGPNESHDYYEWANNLGEDHVRWTFIAYLCDMLISKPLINLNLTCQELAVLCNAFSFYL